MALQAEREKPQPVQGPVGGVEWGLLSFGGISGETPVLAPKPPANHRARLKKASRCHSRKKKGSRNRRKSAIRRARIHRQIRNIRKDFLDPLSIRLAKTERAVVVEDLGVSGMIRNRPLARAIADSGWGEFRRMLGDKCRWYGSETVVAPRWFASTKRCSRCGQVGPKLDLSIRVFVCGRCGRRASRDENAAQNLKWYGEFLRNPTPGETGDAAERERCSRSTSAPSMNQEPSAPVIGDKT